MRWPEQVPTYDGEDSRPSTSSTVATTQGGLRHLPVKAGGSTPGVARKVCKALSDIFKLFGIQLKDLLRN